MIIQWLMKRDFFALLLIRIRWIPIGFLDPDPTIKIFTFLQKKLLFVKPASELLNKERLSTNFYLYKVYQVKHKNMPKETKHYFKIVLLRIQDPDPPKSYGSRTLLFKNC